MTNSTPTPPIAVAVAVDNYLTQKKLQAALSAIVGDDAWQGTEQQVTKGRRFRWDMTYHGPNGLVAVEYDGDAHYRDAIKIRADREKDHLALTMGIQVVRVPYWIQLTTATLKHYFDIDATVTQDFPHGFITTKLFPASYCEMGVARFRSELDGLPTDVRSAVVQSLADRASEHGVEYVLPSALRSLLD